MSDQKPNGFNWKGAFLALLVLTVAVQAVFLIRGTSQAADQKTPSATTPAPEADPAPSPEPKQSDEPDRPGWPFFGDDQQDWPFGGFFDQVPLMDPFFRDQGDTFEQLRRMERRMHQMMNRAFGDRGSMSRMGFSSQGSLAAPKIDLQELPDRFELRVALPDAKNGDLKVEVEDQTVTLQGTREVKSRAEDIKGRAAREEARTQSFQTSIRLPSPIDEDGMKIERDDRGITVTLPKKPAPEKKPVSAGDQTNL